MARVGYHRPIYTLYFEWQAACRLDGSLNGCMEGTWKMQVGTCLHEESRSGRGLFAAKAGVGGIMWSTRNRPGLRLAA
jgi:hypothetical protein